MAENKKAKILYIMRLLLEGTDEDNSVTISQIISYLAKNGISAERKSIYDDIATLRQFGIEIETRKSKTYEYFVTEREFQIPELKLLVDAVQSARFLSQKKSAELIQKLESLCSEHQAKLLNRDVAFSDRVKTINESVYYNIDAVERAIGEKRKISFKYFDFCISKDLRVERYHRKSGKTYQVSPITLSWVDENYYMVAYDAKSDKIKNYRLDKMTQINILKSPAVSKEKVRDFDIQEYMKKTFGMFGGREEFVCLEFANDLLGVVVDRYGGDIEIIKSGKNKFRVNLEVNVSPIFFSWVFGFGTKVRIISPESVLQEMKDRAKAISKMY